MQVQIREVFPKPVWIIIMISIIGIIAIYSYLISPVSDKTEPVIVNIKRGMTTQDIGKLLQEKGLIRNAALFRTIAKIQNLEKSLQAGEYSLTPNMNLSSVVQKLSIGEIVYVQFTVPEGFTLNQVATLLEEKKIGKATKFKEYAAQYQIEYARGVADTVKYKVEGFTFPSTYKVANGVSEKDILDMMVGEFETKLTPAMRKRASEMDMSIWDLITIASLVEKEAKLAKDRPLIARVFLNRIKLDMPLQSCATIQYILGYPKPELTIEDTKIDSPYNTYLHGGLPPGPIANPGLEAIQAVLYPADNDYLYFVADKDGGHRFSRTFAEHLQAINEVQN